MRLLTFFDGNTFNSINLDDVDPLFVEQHINSVRLCEIPYAVTTDNRIEESFAYDDLMAVMAIAYRTKKNAKGTVSGTYF